MTIHDLFALDEIDAGTARKIVLEGREIALVRIEDDVYALGDTCSHADVSLSEGFVEEDECAIECSRHGALFDLKTGEPLSLPALRPVPVYGITIVDGRVQLTIEDAAEESQ
ncbi:MAG: non-heme iron oxygenase ferredoxin subunit [Acidimicrobiales bacterium]|jgi:3-phenylpropionate/trans-cinnamate dioxygenase ferredoxin subunit